MSVPKGKRRRPEVSLGPTGAALESAWLPELRSPSSLRAATGARRVLVLYVLALMLIPANLTIAALGAVGTPALLIGLLALLLWVGAQLNRSHATLSPAQPIRWAMLLFVLTVLVSYVAATIRPIQAVELSSAERGLLLVASWLGIVLLASDGLADVPSIEKLLRVLVVTGGIVAVLGIAQFITGQSLIEGIQIPGLSPNNSTIIVDRNGFTRAAGTSTHPIEFGVALTMILPFALHFAFLDTTRSKFSRWWPIAAMAIAIPITISRSALVGVIVVLAFLLPTWPTARRRISYLVITLLAAVIYIAVPGLLGTLTRLFTGIGGDGSVASRTDSYDLAFEFVARSPIVGRGFSTFLPQYRILDNQYMALLIEVGIVGTLAVLCLFVVAIRSTLRSRRVGDARTRSLATSLAAMITAGACSLATFDAFGFAQVSCLIFLGIALAGALDNIYAREAVFRELGLDAPGAPLA